LRSKTTAPHYSRTVTEYLFLYRNLQVRECHIYCVRFYSANTEKKTCIIRSLSYDRCNTVLPLLIANSLLFL